MHGGRGTRVPSCYARSKATSSPRVIQRSSPVAIVLTTRTILRFKDGSINEETVVFSQRHVFRLISDHQVQKGPAFKQPMDVSVDGLTGQVTVRYTDNDGKEKTVTDRLKLPSNVSNGMVITLLKNIRPDIPLTTLSMVAAAPKPRLVKLLISPEGEDSVSAGGS